MPPKWQAQEQVERRLPVRADVAKLAQIVTEYKAWMQLHGQGAGVDYFKTHAKTIPFFDELSTAHIKAAIARRAKSEQEAHNAQENASAQLLEALVFLCLAQEFDQYQLEIDQGLSNVNHRQREMFNRIQGELQEAGSNRGDNGIADSSLFKPRDLGQYQPQARLRAWLQLWLRDPARDSIFITDSASVMECLSADEDGLQKAFSIQVLAATNEANLSDFQHEETRERLASLLSTTWLREVQTPPVQNHRASEKGIKLSVYIAPNQLPDQLFQPFYPNAFIPPFDGGETQTAIKNTLIGLIEFSPDSPD